MFVINKRIVTAFLAASVSLNSINLAYSETLMGALAKAYNNNSELNSARAGVRVRDEDVAIAKSGYRPTVTGTVTGTYSSSIDATASDTARNASVQSGVTVNQNLFDGFRTKNGLKAAESGVYASREALRNSEQNILFDATSAYVAVIRDRKIAALRKKNVAFLVEQVRSANARFEVGEGTRTDVAQAEASRAAAIAQLNAAEAQANASAANYRELIGESPKDLKAAPLATKLLPKSLDSALTTAAVEHPVIIARKHTVDATAFGVKRAEGELLPTLGVQAGVSSTRSNRSTPFNFTSTQETSNQASVALQLTVPIYQGGRVSAQVRQEKERLGAARIDVDVAADSVRTAVTSSWGSYQAAKASLDANKQLVAAAQLALDGVIEERKVGQRTTLDVLNAQSDVVTSQINLVGTEHDVVLAGYAIVQATGRLSAARLGLNVKLQKPEEHYEAVKDKWFGLRTPDQR
ncbi:MAG: TolC family outer membrane protein [Rhizobiaceae bacterium]